MHQYKDFDIETWTWICQQIDLAAAQPGPHYAAFDADGTLWGNDAGNSFFNYEIENKLLPLPPDPWAHVYRLKDEDPKKAFLWLAQIHNGIKLEVVREWANNSFENSKILKPFPAIRKLIEYLQSKDVTILIVTASVKWSVEPCVAPLNIPAENVLGIKTEIKNGTITDIQDGAITYREGKAVAVLEKTGGISPILSCGNTMGDFWLLELATHIKIAVRSEGQEPGFHDKDISNQELNLYNEAKSRGWITHNFR